MPPLNFSLLTFLVFTGVFKRGKAHLFDCRLVLLKRRGFRRGVDEGCLCGELNGILGWLLATLRALTQNDRGVGLIRSFEEGQAVIGKGGMRVFKVGAEERYYLFPPATLEGILGVEG